MASTSSAGKAPAYDPAIQNALLKAANRIFDLQRQVDSFDALVDGSVLAHMVHELDSDFDPSLLELNASATRYLTNRRNIQNVCKGLFRVIGRQLPELRSQAKKIDHRALAENPEAQGLSQLLALMITLAVLGPDNKKYIPRIQTGMDRETQQAIMRIVSSMQEDIKNAKDDDEFDETFDAAMEARDPDLLVEEQNAALHQQLDITKKTLSDYISRLEHLQLSHEELRYEKEKNDRELEVLRKATQDGASSTEAIKHLETQVHEQMEIIARNEEAILDHDRVKAHLESEVARLTQKSAQAEELRDQVTEWKHRADDLEKKANIAERYKQKLESQQHLVKEVQNLQYERAELQEQLRTLLEEKQRGDRTRKAEDELTSMITQSEQHLWDERSQKNQLMRDVAALEDELVRLRAQRSHDENFIQDLQDQLQQGDTAGLGDSLGGAMGTFNLEDELNASTEDGQPNFALELSRLKAENNLLRRTVGSTGDAVQLRKELDEQKRQRERLQQNFNEMFEKNTIAQEQLDAVSKDMTGEGSDVFLKMRKELVKLQVDHEELQKREKALAEQVADKERDLMEAKSSLSAVEKESVDALDELKSTDKLVSESLKGELDRLRSEHSFVVNERDAQRSQLIDALLAKDKLRKESEIPKDDVSPGTTGDSNVSETVEKLGDKVEKLRTRLKERQQQLEHSEKERIEMQRKLKAVQGGEAAAAEKAAIDQAVRNLRKENGLMATAWYDLTTRLQSNHVVLQRRHDAPKSWLNKQRQMVNGQLLRRRRDSLYLY